MPGLWIERKFSYDHLTEADFPSLVDRLRATPARIESTVKDLPREILTRRDGGSWSIQEQVGHLLEVDALHDGRLTDYDAAASVLRPADMENTRTHAARYNDREIEEVLAGFRGVRGRFVESPRQMGAGPAPRRRPPPPAPAADAGRGHALLCRRARRAPPGADDRAGAGSLTRCQGGPRLNLDPVRPPAADAPSKMSMHHPRAMRRRPPFLHSGAPPASPGRRGFALATPSWQVQCPVRSDD